MKSKNILIFGDKYKLKYVPKVEHLSVEEGFFYRGITDYANRELQIATLGPKGDKLDDIDIRYTTAHECIHAILSSGMYEELAANEPLVEYLAKNIVQLIDLKVL